MLPKIQSPLFETTVPSTGAIITYRPFLVKEEKILLIAKQEGTSQAIVRALKQIISNCVQQKKFDVDMLTSFDIEFLFLKIRASSIDNVIEFRYSDPDDGHTYDLQVDVSKVEVEMPANVKTNIAIGSDVGITLKYPTLKETEALDFAKDQTGGVFSMILGCIDTVYQGETVVVFKEQPLAEREEFVESLGVSVLNNIQEFISKMPKLRHTVKYRSRDGKEKEVVLEGLKDFFTWQ